MIYSHQPKDQKRREKSAQAASKPKSTKLKCQSKPRPVKARIRSWLKDSELNVRQVHHIGGTIWWPSVERISDNEFVVCPSDHTTDGKGTAAKIDLVIR